MEAEAEAESSERAPPTTTGGEARLTVPRPVLHTGRRSRPSAKSSEQLQLEAAAAGGGAFKARPVNRRARPAPKRVLESAGDLGVPRVPRAALTAIAEFRLSRGDAAAAPRGPHLLRPRREEHFAPFKAQPMPIFSPAAAEPPLVRSATKPAPFSLESEARSARMPVGDGWAPQPSQAVTTPRPFQLGSVERAAEYARREEEERRARDFRARPRPKSLGAPSFTPFGCRSDSRASERKAWETEATKRALADSAARARAQHEQQEQAAAEAAEARAKTSFKARPASVLRAKPFQVQRASHEPTKPVSPAFASKRRFGKSLGSAPERANTSGASR
ncbi:hypothetical protein EMIHUDRAFT_211078 [Emiliania huxleyi CCMP1516]|uniref:TPX2 C-terminal domain-containing protein n=2 Tax=Emiliania huxleyi TaxID=2903 RepID=A0A0D3IXP4_EMIH1|nr:hypothetical protein EMIHUDRAFT_211078 [Emiliania huxleyi CCMP1516]EOD16029.1 hypothetical protein EMIHUDRAFT_211078 [Emiliania huxleyi CCMP1516]|eukprot:XP_005768458.1 hypothetical protein EMIHUDRAFT_211078 [Emiliania huxleyi CCMP1516]